LHLRATDALAPERGYLGLQVVTHEEELVPVVPFGGMNRNLGGRKREKQPSIASVYRRQSKKIA
jgi:hypothetical protein